MNFECLIWMFNMFGDGTLVEGFCIIDILFNKDAVVTYKHPFIGDKHSSIP